MAFAVVCKSCQARFLLNDDLLRRKVAGKVVTVRCRQCHATIEVDASEVDPPTLPEVEKPVPPPKLSPKAAKPAPAPPRPTAKSTLMGIGSPAKPGAATELVALSAGFLNMSAPAPAGERGFPEPPPPPGAVEELSMGDWDITETPPLPKSDAAPESVDDFVEELPASLPTPEEEAPSSTGTPSLKALTHHDEHGTKPRADDFLANITAAMNGGIMGGPADGAPTIDVSTLAAATTETSNAPNIDVSDFDAPIEGKKTLPLFALGGDDDAAAPARAPAAPIRARPPASSASLGDDSLSPAALDRPARDADRPVDSPRERKNVVAPATKSVPPPAGQRRSGLAAPVLLALAVAAGFLIWKRSGTHGDVLAHGEPAAPHVVEAPPAALAPAATAEPVLAPAPTAADDVTFETTPMKPAAPAHDKPSASPDASATGAKPADATATPAEPTQPIAKDEPKPPVAPAEPGEPAGPFDRAAAAAALGTAAGQASACRKDGDPSGVASVVITFAPSGRVTSANLSGPPFAGTPTGGCIAAALRKAKVPAFDGDRVTVSKTIVIQ